MEKLPDYEVLGKFYLGREYDLAKRELGSRRIDYDARDLTTHALCVGMTGSGKTGLCISLLEEAAIDGIPAICIDPKGDLGNLLLTFPHLKPSDFLPYLEQGEATKQGLTIEELATQTAERWEKGLASWEQNGARIQRLRDAVDMQIYTPGSSIGTPLTALKSFDAPPQEVLDDDDAFREMVSSAASGILALLGIDADPLSSREHILLATIFDRAWRSGRDLDLAELIRSIQTPGIDRIGVLDLESFMPGDQRAKLANTLNNLLASPSFAGWLQGEPLDIQRLLYTPSGKPRISILSISHLNDAERMFFVTLLLSEFVGWMRSQPGTSSLRAILYMDEIFGYFPPTAKPPSKTPMMTLLKQARAFGIGIVLATQNPADIDYKGLANMGTWFLGRLQTQRDKDRVLDGLEGAANSQGQSFSRAEMSQTLSALGNRVFLMNNVHDDAPTIFQTRWALSFLRGPLSKPQIQGLMKERKSEGAAQRQTFPEDRPASPPKAPSSPIGKRPILPPEIPEKFWIPDRAASHEARTIYRPTLIAQASLHFVKASPAIDHWMDAHWLVDCSEGTPEPVWDRAVEWNSSIRLSPSPDDGFLFADVSADLINPKKYKEWEKQLADFLLRHKPLMIYQSKALKKSSLPGQDEEDARIEMAMQAREARDAEVEKLQAKYATKLKSLQSRILTAEHRVQREREQAKTQQNQSLINLGASIFGALLGNKIASKSNLGKASSAARSLGKAQAQKNDVIRAEESLDELLQEQHRIEEECRQEVDQIAGRFSPENLKLDPIEIPMRKSDLRIQLLGLLWVPYQVDSLGIARPLVDWES